jgi:hypothetical protein
MKNICPITLEEIKEPISVVTHLGAQVVSRLFEAEAILNWLENYSLTDPVNRHHIVIIDTAPGIRTAERLPAGEQFNARIQAIRARLNPQPIRNPAIANSAILRNSPPRQIRANLWRDTNIALPTIITKTQCTSSINDTIKIILLGNASRFQCADVLNSSFSTIGVDFFICASQGNRYGIWDLAGQDKFRNMLRVYSKNANVILYFGEDIDHYYRTLGALDIDIMHTVTIQQTGNTDTLQSSHLDGPVHTCTVRGSFYKSRLLAILDQVMLLPQQEALNQPVQTSANNNNNSTCCIL